MFDSSLHSREATVLRDAYAATLVAVDLVDLTARAAIDVLVSPSPERLVVVALGKSAAPMVAGAVQALGSKITHLVMAAPARAQRLDPVVHAQLTNQGTRVEVFVTGHPLPDENSVQAGTAALTAVAGLTPQDCVLVLLSGGASAAACVPRQGVSLQLLQEATRALFTAGLPIEVVNAIRGRLDKIKHGGLSRAAARTPLVTLAAMDVLGTESEARRTLGSAPTLDVDVPTDPTWLAQARTVLPASVHPWLDEPVRTVNTTDNSTLGPRVFHTIASPITARQALARALNRAGFVVHTRPDAHGPVDRLALTFAAWTRQLAPGTAWVAVGEPTVRLPSQPGRGGRAGRLALQVARCLDGQTGRAFLAGATDGVDGESGHAGAVVTGHTLSEARARGIDVDAALAAFHDAAVHEALNTTLDPGPTGINLLDVYAGLCTKD